MTWDFVEINPFCDIGGSFSKSAKIVAEALETNPMGPIARGNVLQADAADQATFDHLANVLVSTDPPYYDNVPYANLSDIFYVWLRRSLRSVFPDIFGTLLTPKANE